VNLQSALIFRIKLWSANNTIRNDGMEFSKIADAR
jgi:hypothetical protein